MQIIRETFLKPVNFKNLITVKNSRTQDVGS